MSEPYTGGMNARGVWLGIGIALAVVIAAVFFYMPSAQTAGPAGLVGRTAPDFSALDLAGRPVSLADYRGKIVVVNLWASWCPPCRAEMPDLQKLATAFRSRGVVVLGVDQGESAQRARAFADALGITYPVLVDDGQQSGGIYAAFGLPTTIVVGRDGVVVKGVDGPLAYAEMQAVVAPLVDAK